MRHSNYLIYPFILEILKIIKLRPNIGRYGPYVKYDKKFISIPGGKSPFEIDLDSAIKLILEKEKVKSLL